MDAMRDGPDIPTACEEVCRDGGGPIADWCPGWADSADPGWIYEPDGLRLLAVNDAALRHYGFERHEFLRMSLWDLEAAPAAAAAAGRPATPASDGIRSGVPCGIRRHRTRSGATVDMELSACPLRPANRATSAVFARDVTERERERRRAAMRSDQLRLAEVVFERNNDAVTITDGDNRIVAVNAAFTRITGYEQAEVLGQNPRVLSSGRQDKFFYQEMWRALLERGSWEGEICNRRKNGECYPEWLKISVVRDAAGATTHHVAMFSDISKAKAAEAQIHQLAFYDALTGLPNRVLARERMVDAIGKADRDGWRVGVLFIDLDRFKVINDSLGHHVGDGLLKEVGRRLRAALRATDTVARLGGDEFLVLLPGIGSADEIAPIANALVRRVTEPFTLEGHALRVAPSIGITVYPDDASDYDTLLRNADIAMYKAKQDGRSGYRFYCAALHANASRLWQIERDMRDALALGQYRLHYQPQVDLATGARIGCEALVRWQHPERGMIAPDQFIPVAEETGFIAELGEWVLHEACRQNRAWQDAGQPALPVAVNVSAYQFQRAGFYDTVVAALAQNGLAAACLELEMTERIVMDDAQGAIELLQRLRALGVRLAIDDFGTGYSSLGYLRRLPVDKLKIDRSFIRDIEQSRENLAVTQAVITLGRNLGMTVVAEGIETAAQANVLIEHGCEQGQGYYFGRPAPDGLCGEAASGSGRAGIAADQSGGGVFPAARSDCAHDELLRVASDSGRRGGDRLGQPPAHAVAAGGQVAAGPAGRSGRGHRTGLTAAGARAVRTRSLP